MKSLFAILLTLVLNKAHAVNHEQIILNYVVRHISNYIAPTMEIDDIKKLQIYVVPKLKEADLSKGLFSGYSIYAMFKDSLSIDGDKFERFEYWKDVRLKANGVSRIYRKDPENIYTDKELFGKVTVVIQIFSRVRINDKLYIFVSLAYPGPAEMDILFEIDDEGKIIREFVQGGVN